MQPLCTKCFGKGLCGRSQCPILAKFRVQKKVSFNKDFQGISPNVFVGRFGYPNINVGVLATENYSDNDNPLAWSANKTPISDIIDKRVSLVNSSFKSNIKLNQNKFVDTIKEISLSKSEVDVEVNLQDKPHLNISFNQDVMPHGPRETLKKINTTSNIKVPKIIDTITSDTDLKSTLALSTLNKKGIDEYYITKLFSAGNFGTKEERKLVPTRWSITAVDDILGKSIFSQILYNKENSEHLSFFGGLKGNYYLLLILPGLYSYELYETYLPKTIWNNNSQVTYTTDYEDFLGRNKYAENTAGGYYAARLPILRYLEQNKIQARIIALRFITPDYYAPLGVWYCRESVVDSLNNKSINFSSQELLLKYAKNLILKKFGYDITDLLKTSKTLKNNQKSLSSFL